MKENAINVVRETAVRAASIVRDLSARWWAHLRSLRDSDNKYHKGLMAGELVGAAILMFTFGSCALGVFFGGEEASVQPAAVVASTSTSSASTTVEAPAVSVSSSGPSYCDYARVRAMALGGMSEVYVENYMNENVIGEKFQDYGTVVAVKRSGSAYGVGVDIDGHSGYGGRKDPEVILFVPKSEALGYTIGQRMTFTGKVSSVRVTNFKNPECKELGGVSDPICQPLVSLEDVTTS